MALYKGVMYLYYRLICYCFIYLTCITYCYTFANAATFESGFPFIQLPVCARWWYPVWRLSFSFLADGVIIFGLISFLYFVSECRKRKP